MVVPVRSKIVAFKEDQYKDDQGQEIIASSTASMTYELDGYSEERRNVTNEITLIETFDDSLSSDASVVDAKNNPTQLYLQLNYGLWDVSLNAIKNRSTDIMTWLMRDGVKLLPIHVACESTCPVGIIEAFLDYSPQCLQYTTSKGSLPLHLLCANENFLLDEDFILKIMEAFPESLFRADQSNRTPLEILYSLPENVKIKCKTLIGNFEDKIRSIKGSRILNQKVGDKSKAQDLAEKTFRCATDFISSPSMDERESLAMKLNSRRMEPTTIGISEITESCQNLHSEDTHRDRDGAIDDDTSTNSHQDQISDLNDQKEMQRMGNREQTAVGQSMDISDDEILSTYSSVSQTHNSPMKIVMLMKENMILRQKVIGLSKDNTSLESDRDVKESIIEDLKKCVSKERELSKTNTRDYELAITRLTDQMNEVKNSAHFKRKSEVLTANRISQLELNIASRSAELSTVESALSEEAASNANLAKQLFIQRNENEKLIAALDFKENGLQTTRRQLEVVTKEFETYRKLNDENKSKMNHTVKESKLIALQNRALTDALSAIDKKNQKLDKLNEALQTEIFDVKNMLKLNAETYAANIGELESDVERFRKSETDAVREREQMADNLSQKLQEVNTENDDLRKQVEVGKQETERLSHDIDSLRSESSLKSSKIDETERRLDTLYVELVKKQNMEKDMEQENEDYKRKIDELSQAQIEKTQKLRVLQEAVESYKSEIEVYATKKSEDDKTITKTLEALTKSEEQLENESNRAAELESKLSASEGREEKTAEKANELEEQVKELIPQAEKMKRQLEEMRQETEEQETITSQRKVDLEKLTSDYKELKGTNVMVQNDYSQLKSEFGELRQEYNVLQGTSKHQQALFEALQQDNKDLKGINTKIKDDYEQLAKDFERVERDFNETEGARDKTQDEYKQLKAIFEKLEPKYHDLHESNNTLNDKLKELRALYQQKEKDKKAITQQLELARKRSQQQERLLKDFEKTLDLMVQNHVAQIDPKQLQSTPNEELDSENATNSAEQDLKRLITVLKARLSELETKEALLLEFKQSNATSQETILRLKEELKLSVDTVKALTRAERAQILSVEQTAQFLKEKERTNSKLKEQKESWNRQEQELESEINELKEQLDSTKLQIDTLSKGKETLNEKLRQQQQQWKTHQEKLEEDAEELKKQLSFSSKKSRLLKMDLESYKETTALLERTISQLRKTVSQQNEILHMRNLISDEMKKEVTIVQKESDESSEELKTLQSLNATKLETIEFLEEELTSLQGQLDERSEALRIAAEENNELNKESKELRTLQSRYNESLEEISALKEEVALKQMQLDQQLVKHSEEAGKQSEDVARLRQTLQESMEAQKTNNADIIASLGEELALMQEELNEKRAECEELKQSNAATEAENEKVVEAIKSSTLSKLQSSEEALKKKAEELEAIKAEEVSKEKALVTLKTSVVALQKSLEDNAAIEAERKKEVELLGSATLSKLNSSEELLSKRTEELETIKLEMTKKEEDLITLKASVASLTHGLDEKRNDCQKFEDINKSYQVEVGRLLKKNDALRDEKEKEQFQRDYYKVAEDNTANSANIEYLLGNLKLSEHRVLELTSKHKALVHEVNELRKVAAEKGALNTELQELNNRLMSMDNKASEISETASTSSAEWDKHITGILLKYSHEKVPFDYESISRKASNRTNLREALRKKVTETFESQSSKINELSGRVQSTENQASKCETKLRELESTNETLKLENKILKTTGKDIDKRFHKMQHKLKEENRRLKQAIAKLSQETMDHQKNIRDLVVKHAELQRKKEVVFYSRNEETIGLPPQKKPSTEDGGSLVFSLSSQDIEDYSPHCNDTVDRSIEIVLQESRDEREKIE
mmetsp:Transcript_13896/g.20512  ORF Transcript_13896/g.20512 Transcript_13896/m.20512 type:complete len:1875 (-) Transcript_13896:46-5670(-)